MRKFFMLWCIFVFAGFVFSGNVYPKTMQEIKDEIRAEVREEFNFKSPAASKIKAKQRVKKQSQDKRNIPVKTTDRIVVELVILAMLLALIPAIIAKVKGRSFIAWWVLSVLLFVVVFPCSIFMKSTRKGKTKTSKKNQKIKETPESSKTSIPPASRPESAVKSSTSPAKLTEMYSKEQFETGAIELYEKIERLSQLKNKGILTEEEFNNKKNELLDRI